MRHIVLEAVRFRSSHGLLKACSGDVGWRNAGKPCPSPEWTAPHEVPVSHTLGETVRIALTLEAPDRAEDAGPLVIHGSGPEGLSFSPVEGAPAVRGEVDVGSRRPLAKKIDKQRFAVRWSAGDGETVTPGRTVNTLYTTLGRPQDDKQEEWPEDGVTLKRMDRAVEWVRKVDTLEPHAIVEALMGKFPFYALHPSPKVPRKYHHPTYFNDAGGAWPMSDHVGESGECQAIVRLVRAVLRQIGVPGEARAIVVWGDPEVDGGTTALSAELEGDPSAGLSRTKLVDGHRWTAALVDSPVEVGKTYPASHTPERGGPSPGFNRFEACLEFTSGGKTLDYGGGAGVFPNREAVLRGFWGLVWMSAAPHHGFRVEQIVTQY